MEVWLEELCGGGCVEGLCRGVVWRGLYGGIVWRGLCRGPAKNLLWFTTVNLLWFTTVKRSVFAEYLLRFTIVNTMVYHSIYYGLLQ